MAFPSCARETMDARWHPRSSSSAVQALRRSESGWRGRSTAAGACFPRGSALSSSRWRSTPRRARSSCAARAIAKAAGRDLNAASEQLAAAMIETAEADPELDDVEVEQLRDDLRRELERLATADIKALTPPRSATRPPPGRK